MKAVPTADYPVQVLRQEWEEEAETSRWYEGIFTVTLNHHVEVVFVPDVSAAAPPWDGQLLPEDLDQVETAQQARIATALLSPYVVTPNQARAGTAETFQWQGGGQDAPQVVYYLTTEEFASYAADLDRLTSVTGDTSAGTRVSELREYPVIGFLEQRIVASSHLDPRHAVLLGRSAT